MDVHTFLFWKRIGLATLLSVIGLCSVAAVAQVTVAQISDTHIGDKHAPHAAANLRQAVQMINARHPDAVILSGDIGENPQAWEQARSILADLKPPLYYAPGNHDVHSTDVERYRRVFGKDYYTFQMKDITFVVIDSALLGNIDSFDAKQPQPLPPQTEAESEGMLNWLANLRGGDADRKDDRKHRHDREPDSHVFIGIQHIPVFRDGNFPPDSKPYWVINDPYRGQEMKILHDLGIKDMLVGHWHNGRVFDKDGITWHVAPSTSWLPWGGKLGFAMHTINPDGKVKTEFVDLPDARP
jgi:DNA repair exonuclease SbcCD nuclease subunit